MRRLLFIVVLAGGLWGCSSVATPTSPSSGGPVRDRRPGPRRRSDEPASDRDPDCRRDARQVDGGGTAGPRVGPVVVTVADGLRVRSLPRVSDDSILHEPVLPIHTKLFVLGAPVTASGYTWYDVVPLGSRTLPSGWVAAASRSGEPWLATAEFACPPVPTDFKALAALAPAVGVACFPRTPITVRARIVGCNCEVDGPTYVPAWFSVGNAPLLVEPSCFPRTDGRAPSGSSSTSTRAVTTPRFCRRSGLVDVTGIFDHPAAAGCTSSGMDDHQTPTNECRLRFAVTRLAPVGS